MLKILKRVSKSGSFAVAGIRATLRSEFMSRFYLAAYIVIIIAAAFSGFSLVKWAIVIIAGSGVLAFELINTGVEKAVDMYGEEHSELGAFAKDAAAGSVFLFAWSGILAIILLFIDQYIH